MMAKWMAIAVLAAMPVVGHAGVVPDGMTFPSIDGGDYNMDEWRGHPVLVVNTASLCAFAPQYEGLQALSDRFEGAGLIVLAVPSDDFRQELDTDGEVKDFCELTWGVDLPMTTITHVRGAEAHPFYQWLAQSEGFEPGWNFNKVLIGADGDVLGTWGSVPRPETGQILSAVEAALGS